MKAPLYNQEGKAIGTVTLRDAVFAVPMNGDLLYQVVSSQESNRRRVIAHTKGRGEVRGGGKKPWQQKGTGRARHGSIRSPIWKGGGVTFGPTKEREFSKKINKKMARKALAVALSAKLRANELAVVDDVHLQEIKTKKMAKVLSSISAIFGGRVNASTLVVVPSAKSHSGLVRASRNMPRVDSVEARNVNTRQVLASERIVVLKDGLDDLARSVRPAA